MFTLFNPHIDFKEIIFNKDDMDSLIVITKSIK